MQGRERADRTAGQGDVGVIISGHRPGNVVAVRHRDRRLAAKPWHRGKLVVMLA
jgi:hypothetical protein